MASPLLGPNKTVFHGIAHLGGRCRETPIGEKMKLQTIIKVFLSLFLLLFCPLFIDLLLEPLGFPQSSKDAYVGNIFMLICCVLLAILRKSLKRKGSKWALASLILMVLTIVSELCVLLFTWEFLLPI